MMSDTLCLKVTGMENFFAKPVPTPAIIVCLQWPLMFSERFEYTSRQNYSFPNNFKICINPFIHVVS